MTSARSATSSPRHLTPRCRSAGRSTTPSPPSAPRGRRHREHRRVLRAVAGRRAGGRGRRAGVIRAVGGRAPASRPDRARGRLVPDGRRRARGLWDDGEGPIHVVELSPYRISARAVTNDDFGAFVDATGHTSEAERFGWSFVFAGFLPDDFPDTRAVAQTPVVAAGARRRLAPSRGPALRPRRAGRPPRRARLVGRRRRGTASGAEPACRPRPSGSTPPAAGSAGARTRGATTSSPADATP